VIASRSTHACWRISAEDVTMYDVLMLAIGCGFFVAAVLYVLACEKM
jgi:hypothetical protein